MKEYDFLDDAKRLIRFSAPHISESMGYDSVIQGMTFYSFGIERLLKHIIFLINPAFILSNSEFRNSAPALYKEKFVIKEKADHVVKDPNLDLISFRVALQRALLFSNAVQNNKQLLHTIAHYRDIIAHKPTSQIDIEKAGSLLGRDGFNLVEAICAEIDISVDDFLSEYSENLSRIRAVIIDKEKLGERMGSLLEAHCRIWKSRKDDESFIKRATEITRKLLASSCSEFAYEKFECPACDQSAVVRIEPDFDYDGIDHYLSGVFVDFLECHFCDIKIEGYKELDFIKVNSVFERDAGNV